MQSPFIIQDMRYHPQKIEKKWQKQWIKEKIYEPDLKKAKRPFYNLMMFPYPSAEGLHIGGVRTFAGVDVYGRLKRMQGYDVFEPIGLDGFGIHSENYAIKTGIHPAKQAKITEKNFYRQLGEIGNGFAWKEKLDTYDPEYYKWTQWIFTEMFRKGLAYRKKAMVNWCPSCKTVLADEQVLRGECERCGTKVIKKELEQWFFRITNYAGRLLKNLEKIDWSEQIKIAQRNWIGKSEGAEIEFEVKIEEKPNFLILHGYTGQANRNFLPWLRLELEKRGHKVQAPQMPDTDNPKEKEQVAYVLNNCGIDENTVIVGHSLGGLVAMKVLQKYGKSIRGLILVAPAVEPKFRTGSHRPFWDTFSWDDLDYGKLKRLPGFRKILSDLQEPRRKEYLEYLSQKINADLIVGEAKKEHFTDKIEPMILDAVAPPIKIFTTRPDTLFGATYIVLSPEHPLIQNFKCSVSNFQGVEKYVKAARAKTGEERVVATGDKTGIELKGIKAINPATKEEIPIWVADYVLGGVGTGAIMAVPAHDQRDFEFATKFNLPIKIVVCPHYPAMTCPILDRAYEGDGHLVASEKFSGLLAERAKWEITKFVGGNKKTQYRLRDWLISRQRYWGPPIPMIFCEACRDRGVGLRKDMPGWYPVEKKALPVKLPYIKEFRPTGQEESPLSKVEKFYKVRCPKCKSMARRETDVSDTFFDSGWYYLRYPSVHDAKQPWNPAITKKWLPVDMYIGGAEHAVLHLLYVRFLAMVFYDWKAINFEEPFKKFRTHGLITKDGAKMSKSKGNVVSPDVYIPIYGSDALRMYLLFLAPLDQGGDFRDEGIRGITRFLERVWKICHNFNNRAGKNEKINSLDHVVHKTIKKVTEDIKNLQYNTAISALMVLLNNFEEKPDAVLLAQVSVFLRLLAPFAPHLAEELWQTTFKNKKFKSVHLESWPTYNPKLIEEKTFELVVQINGKMRDKFIVPSDITEKEATRLTLENKKVKMVMEDRTPKKIVFVPRRLINIVL